MTPESAAMKLVEILGKRDTGSMLAISEALNQVWRNGWEMGMLNAADIATETIGKLDGAKVEDAIRAQIDAT